MKILIYSPPFKGHLNVLKQLIEKHEEYEFKLIITTWNNLLVDGEINLAKSELKETDPCLWTFSRVYELMNDSISIAKEYKPDLIIYDFFSLEGKFTADILKLPSWCSIPALLGPNDKQEYIAQKLSNKINVEFIKKITDKYGIDIKNIELVSDGFFIPGDVNLIWSYPELTPFNFMFNRQKRNYYFIGNYNNEIKRDKDTIYFSLGTVVMHNLWNQQEKTQIAVRNFVQIIANELKNEKVLFLTQGKKVLDKYPDNWEIKNTVDQVQVLSRSKIFITHGGNNSYHEAVLQKVPMVVIPFFGDQILVAQKIQELKIGINLNQDTSIDTHKSKTFLNKQLALKTVNAVKEILNNFSYQNNLDNLKLSCSNFSDILSVYFK